MPRPRKSALLPIKFPAFSMRATATLAYIGLGSNLGNRLLILKQAVSALAQIPETRLLRCSSLYQSLAAEGAAGSADFFNAVAELSTNLNAHALLDELQAIELQAGRLRPYHHAPRTLDLDILLFGQENITDAPRLIVPHPRLWLRDFAYKPLLELQPDLARNQHPSSTGTTSCKIHRKNWLPLASL